MPEVPRVVADFLSGKAQQFARPIVSLPGWRNAKVKFQSVSDWAPIELDMDLDRAKYPSFTPIANIENASEFLVVDTGQEDLPVLMFDHEVGKFVPGFDDFESFVAAVREGS